MAQQVIDLRLCLLTDFTVLVNALKQSRRAEVGCQDNNGIFEIDGTSLRVGNSAVIEYLQQDIEDIRVCLFDFIEQDNRIWLSADSFGQLTAFFISDISGRRTDQARYRIFFHIFRHIDADQIFLVIKQGRCQCLCQLGFADTGRAEEQERTDGTVRVLNACTRTQDGFGDTLDCFILSDDALMQRILQMQQLFALTLHQAGNRNTGPTLNDACNFLICNLITQQSMLAFGFFGTCFFLFQLLFQLRQAAIFQLSCLI